MRYLSTARKLKGYSQNEMANYLGITKSAYQFYEYGTRDGTIENWIKLEKLLEVPMIKLYEEITGEEKDCPTLERQSSQKKRSFV